MMKNQIVPSVSFSKAHFQCISSLCEINKYMFYASGHYNLRSLPHFFFTNLLVGRVIELSTLRLFKYSRPLTTSVKCAPGSAITFRLLKSHVP